MASKYKDLIRSRSEYTRIYSNFRGVEESASESTGKQYRLAYSKNLYRSYMSDIDASLESIPGYRKLAMVSAKINGLHHQKGIDCDYCLIHAGSALYRFPVKERMPDNVYPLIRMGTLKDTRSVSVGNAGAQYIFDGENITRVKSNGEVSRINDEETAPYVPTLYVSGKRYEERNLLTDAFKEEYAIASVNEFAKESEGLYYTVTDGDLMQCELTGVSDSVSGDVYVPAYVMIAGLRYAVKSVAPRVFYGNSKITALYFGEGLASVGAFAFSKCSSLERAVFRDGLISIAGGAFGECMSLSELYLPESLSEIGTNALSQTQSLTVINYSGDERSFSEIDGAEYITGRAIEYGVTYKGGVISLPIHADCISVTAIRKDKYYIAYTPISEDDRIKSVEIEYSSPEELTGKVLILSGLLSALSSSFGTGGVGISGRDAIVASRIATVYDGRIFLSGNPTLPNTVFYSATMKANENDPLYFPELNYFNDGVGGYPVLSLLASGEMLAVFKAGDDGGGSIFYHKRAETESYSVPVIYPVAYVHSGIVPVGPSFSYLDTPVFLASTGVYSLESSRIDYRRNIALKSRNVNYSLQKEDLSGASLCEWQGYLFVGVNGKAYLGDSRSTFVSDSGEREYEWFTLDGLGAYVGERAEYRYAPESSSEHYSVKVGYEDQVPECEVYSFSDENGVDWYYTYEDGEHYLLYMTERRMGGTFSPADIFVNISGHLIFGTPSGHIMMFNTDRVGEAPKRIMEKDDFDPDEYERIMGRVLHPDFYTFAGHDTEYILKTSLDDCDIPHLLKNTVKRSLVIKAQAALPEAIVCEAVSDRSDPHYIGAIPPPSSDFESFDFRLSPWNKDRYISYALREKEKAWIEKQIILSSRGYASPISIYSIVYRYEIKGRIKTTG